MKFQTTKKLFVFITMMMFFSLTQFAIAQVYPDLGGFGHICYCPNIKVSCKGDASCLAYCRSACKSKAIKIIKNSSVITSFTTNYLNNISKSNMVSFELPQLMEMNPLKLFENKKSTLKLENNSQTEFIQQTEWSNKDAINSTSSKSNFG